MYSRNRGADAHRSAVTTVEAGKNAHTQCPGHLYSDERSYFRSPLAAESVRCLDKTGSVFDDQLTTDVVGVEDNDNPHLGELVGRWLDYSLLTAEAFPVLRWLHLLDNFTSLSSVSFRQFCFLPRAFHLGLISKSPTRNLCRTLSALVLYRNFTLPTSSHSPKRQVA